MWCICTLDTRCIRKRLPLGRAIDEFNIVGFGEIVRGLCKVPIGHNPRFVGFIMGQSRRDFLYRLDAYIAAVSFGLYHDLFAVFFQDEIGAIITDVSCQGGLIS